MWLMCQKQGDCLECEQERRGDVVGKSAFYIFFSGICHACSRVVTAGASRYRLELSRESLKFP